MAAYRRVYGFGHLRADCRGPGSVPEPYARFEYGTTFTFTLFGDYEKHYFFGELMQKEVTSLLFQEL